MKAGWVMAAVSAGVTALSTVGCAADDSTTPLTPQVADSAPSVTIPADSTTDPSVILTGTAPLEPLAPEAVAFLETVLDNEGARTSIRCESDCSEYVEWAASNYVGLAVCVQRGDFEPVIERFSVAVEGDAGRLAERVRTSQSCAFDAG